MITDAELAALCASVYPPSVRSGRRQGIHGIGPDRRIYTALGFRLVRWIDTDAPDDTQVAVFVRRHAAVIAIRGTTTLWDWAANLGARFFLGSWRRRWAGVSDEIREVIDGLEDVHAVYVIGHSLGGALAYHGILDYCDTHSAELVAFGAPRAVSPRLEQALLLSGVTARRYEVESDPIPWIPRGRWGTYGVRHVLPCATWWPSLRNHAVSHYRAQVEALEAHSPR